MSNQIEETEKVEEQEEFSLNDDRRVKTLSPGALVAKRFFRNRLAVVGLSILIAMFVFSFIGGIVTPYGQAEQFYKVDSQLKEYVGVMTNVDLRYIVADGQTFDSIAQSNFYLALTKNKTEFENKGDKYKIVEEGEDTYTILKANSKIDTVEVAMAFKDIVNDESGAMNYTVKSNAIRAYVAGKPSFEADGAKYSIDAAGNITKNGEVVGYISRLVVSALLDDVAVSRAFKENLAEHIEAAEANGEFANAGRSRYSFTDVDGVTADYIISKDGSNGYYSVQQSTATYVYDTYSAPSAKHLLGTDKNGMDMLTRLMYGGRVSLIIGFVVVIIETVIGVILGGISGYFGKWVDQLIMRIVDVFYCIPSTPLLIILGSAMDALKVSPDMRMLLLMAVLGFLGWPSIARLVRGQILSLREQEFMTATEACGIRVSRRIFKHLIPNVIPQLIVICTMSLGSTIITESTLSFLGLGVKFPYATWGNIINDVNNSFVMTHYWFIWIPASICLLITVLGFNFVGDGLRDAFDPRMKR